MSCSSLNSYAQNLSFPSCSGMHSQYDFWLVVFRNVFCPEENCCMRNCSESMINFFLEMVQRGMSYSPQYPKTAAAHIFFWIINLHFWIRMVYFRNRNMNCVSVSVCFFFSSNYLIKSERSSMEECGFGFFMWLGRQASYFLLITVFPPNFTNASTCSSVHSSSFSDRTYNNVKLC